MRIGRESEPGSARLDQRRVAERLQQRVAQLLQKERLDQRVRGLAAGAVHQRDPLVSQPWLAPAPRFGPIFVRDSAHAGTVPRLEPIPLGLHDRCGRFAAPAAARTAYRTTNQCALSARSTPDIHASTTSAAYSYRDTLLGRLRP